MKLDIVRLRRRYRLSPEQEGVNVFDVYQSNNGELVGLVDVDSLGAVDNILVDAGCRAVFGEFAALTKRTGGELLFGRPAWQALYGEE